MSKKQGFGSLYCPLCREVDAVSLRLDGESPDGEFCCNACGEGFEIAEVQAIIDAAAKWSKVLKWVATMPTDAE